MIASSIHSIALNALRTRTLVRLPFEGGGASRVRTEATLSEAQPEPPEPIARLIDELWATKGAGKYDGKLVGVTNVAVAGDSVTLACRAIRYRDYIATDRVFQFHPNFQLPLAVGVHAILTAEEGVVCLRLQDGSIALPGGAVDADDLISADIGAVLHGAEREVREETGIELNGQRAELTGLYVGGYPTHLIAMLAADVRGRDIGRMIRTFSPRDAMDRVRSIEVVPLAELLAAMQELPLVVRAALRSLLHRQGVEPAWTIST